MWFFSPWVGLARLKKVALMAALSADCLSSWVPVAHISYSIALRHQVYIFPISPCVSNPTDV